MLCAWDVVSRHFSNRPVSHGGGTQAVGALVRQVTSPIPHCVAPMLLLLWSATATTTPTLQVVSVLYVPFTQPAVDSRVLARGTHYTTPEPPPSRIRRVRLSNVLLFNQCKK